MQFCSHRASGKEKDFKTNNSREGIVQKWHKTKTNQVFQRNVMVILSPLNAYLY